MTTNIKHIRQFRQPISQLFADAIQLPQFFKTNLIDDLRVVKYFHNDPQANIKIFYYQYLKLCFEIDNVDYESYIEKIYQLIRTEGFEFYFEPDDEERALKNAQYKSLLVDFFELMNTSSMTIDTVLKQYPILNDVFTNFFRTVVMIASIAQSYDSYIDKNQLFDFLSSFFSVDISSYDKCLKFVESDIFVYEQDQYNIYMAFIAEEVEEKDEEEEEEVGDRVDGDGLLGQEMRTVKEDQFESEVSGKSEDNQQHPVAMRLVQHSATNSSFEHPQDFGLKPRAKTIIKQSYIQAQFADYTSLSNISHNLGQNLVISTQKEVFIEELQPTVNETQTDMGDNVGRELQSGDRLLMRVQSAQNSVLLANTTTIPPATQSTQPMMIHTSPQQQQQQQLTKATSQPNFFTRQKPSLHDLVQSCLQSQNSNIQAQHHFEQIPQHESYGDSRHSSCNVIPGEKQVKRNIVSLGLEQNNMYVSYEEPTKDPGFTGSLASRHVEQQLSSEQLPSYKNNYPFTKSANPIIKQTPTNTNKPITQLDQPLFYMPKPTYTPSSFPNSRMVQSLNSQKQPLYNTNNINKNLPTSTIQPSQRLKLNVTNQFTNSMVMKCMSQPSKTEVHLTRQRARNYRKSIYQQLLNYNSNRVSQTKNNYNSKLIEQNYNDNTTNKLPTRINFPSETSLKTVSTNNPTTREQFSQRNNTKQQTQQTQSANIYPISMLMKQQPKTYNSIYQQQPLTKTSTTNTFNLQNNNTALSKISQLKEIQQIVSSPQSKKTVESRPNEKIGQERSSQQSKFDVSIYQSAQETANNTYKLPSYQPVLIGKKPSITQQKQPYAYQPAYQSQLNKPYYNGTQTVMPHYLNSPQKTNTHQQSIPKTYSHNLVSLLPQTQKPLPLYVPFERRK